jgi:lambda family phage tail tape measure protein
MFKSLDANLQSSLQEYENLRDEVGKSYGKATVRLNSMLRNDSDAQKFSAADVEKLRNVAANIDALVAVKESAEFVANQTKELGISNQRASMIEANPALLQMGSEIESFLQAKRDMDKLAQNIIDARDAGGNRLNKDQIQRMEAELSALGKALGDATQIFVNKIKEGIAESVRDLNEEITDLTKARDTRFMREGDKSIRDLQTRKAKTIEAESVKLSAAGYTPEQTTAALSLLSTKYDELIAKQSAWNEYDRSFLGALQNSVEETSASMQTVGEMFLDTMDGMQQTMSAGLEKFILEGKFKLKDFAISVHGILTKIVSDYISTLARIGLQKAIGSIIGSFGGSSVGTASSLDAAAGPGGAATAGPRVANGLAFNSGNILAFAGGGTFTNGTVNRPTHFPIGLMGEAGPEAVMPLTRDSAGRLGVRASGGSSSISNNSITITVNVSGEGNDEPSADNKQQTMMKAMSESLRAVVLKTVTEEMRKGGSLNQYRS